MLKKVLGNFGYVGVLALFAGIVTYSTNKEWGQLAILIGLVLLLVYLVSSLGSIKSALTSRGGRQGITAGASVVLVLGILVLVNFLNYRHHRRIDLSEGGVHSISEQSRQIVQTLDSEMKVLGFFVDQGESQAFENLMKEYRFASSRFSYEVVDPQQDIARTTRYEIDRASQIVVELNGKTQKVESATEEAITNAIIKLTRDEEKVVYFLEGHKEHDLSSAEEDGYQAVRNAVERQNYVVKTVNLAVEGALPDDVTVLVSAGPERNFLPHEVQALEEYLVRGGKLLLMVDPRTEFQMNEFLSKFGVELADDMIIDASPLGQLFGLGPAAPLVASYATHPISEGLNVTTFFPLAQSLRSVDSSLGYEVRELYSSSESSWGETDVIEGEEVAFDEGTDQQGPLPMALVATLKTEVAEESGGDAAAETGDEPGGSESSELESRLVVLGDSDFVTNRFLSVGGGNTDLFLNIVSWLAEDTDLVAIRPKDPTNRQVTLTERDSALLFWIAVIFLPLATLVLGLSVWIRRK